MIMLYRGGRVHTRHFAYCIRSIAASPGADAPTVRSTGEGVLGRGVEVREENGHLGRGGVAGGGMDGARTCGPRNTLLAAPRP